MGVNPTFTVNDFNKPKVLTETETYVNDFMMILFGRPGFYPSIPTIGLDIRSYLYKFEDEISTDEIKTKIANQCSDYLPMIQEGNFDVLKTVYRSHVLLVFVLPSINNDQVTISIGITTTDNGDVIYNFVENKYQEV